MTHAPALQTLATHLERGSASCFYIDEGDILATAQVFNIHSLLKGGVLPTDEAESICQTCYEAVNEDEIELMVGALRVHI